MTTSIDIIRKADESHLAFHAEMLAYGISPLKTEAASAALNNALYFYGVAATTNGWSIPSVAKVCHEANRAFCESLGDFSQLPWDHAPQLEIDRAISGIQFYMENPDVEAGIYHCAAYFTPYSDLPAHRKEKDRLFKIVGTLLSMVTLSA